MNEDLKKMNISWSDAEYLGRENLNEWHIIIKKLHYNYYLKKNQTYITLFYSIPGMPPVRLYLIVMNTVIFLLYVRLGNHLGICV